MSQYKINCFQEWLEWFEKNPKHPKNKTKNIPKNKIK